MGGTSVSSSFLVIVMFGDRDEQVADMGSILFGNHASINEWTDDSDSESVLLDNMDSLSGWVDVGDDS